MPVVGIVTTAWTLLGETISLAQILGGVVILIGLGVVRGLAFPKADEAGHKTRPHEEHGSRRA